MKQGLSDMARKLEPFEKEYIRAQLVFVKSPGKLGFVRWLIRCMKGE